MREQIMNDLKTAMKNQNKELLNVIRMVKGAIQLEEINVKHELTDEEMVSLISKQIKSRKETIDELKNSNRSELLEKTENEISLSDNIIAGDVYIGAGETDAVRLLAKIAKEIQSNYPDIHYHISSGNAEFVLEQLDKGLIYFGLVFGNVDSKKYNALKLSSKDTWGVLMRKDSELSHKKYITPKDLYDKPLIISHQRNQGGDFSSWLNCNLEKLNIVATYNLLFNASLLVDEGLGYAIVLDKIINTGDNSNLCFRPLEPAVEAELSFIWKKYQVFSKAAEQFLIKLKES